KQIGTEVKERRDEISAYDGELKRLQPLRERANQLQLLIDSADAAQSRVTEEQARLDAVNVMLENESFAQDVREQLAALDTERAQIGYDRSSHDSARQQLDTYREFEVRQKELELALSALPDVEAALEGARLRRERTEKVIAEYSEK